MKSHPIGWLVVLTDIPFEYHPDITNNFVDALDFEAANAPEDLEFNLVSKFNWIEASHRERISSGAAGFDPVIQVMDIIKQNKDVRELFSEIATSARAEKSVYKAALIEQNLTELGGRLLKHIDEKGSTDDSLLWFVMLEY